MIESLLGILFSLLVSYLELSLGIAAIELLGKLFKIQIKDISLPVAFVIGVLLHSLSALLLKLLAAPWWLAGLAIFLPWLFVKRLWKPRIEDFLSEASFNFLLWIFIVLAVGLSLMTAGKEISTAWTNNYGDLTFHIGMISSFVFGDNFPPQYPIFAGESLSYPFFINLWSALLWWPIPTWQLLSFVFLLQWTLVWVIVFKVLRGEKYYLLPWAVFLGGGSYALLGEKSWEFLNKGFPWTVFLSTLWVTQRTFLLGLITTLVALLIAFRGVEAKDNKFILARVGGDLYCHLALLGFVSGLAFICHGHAALITWLFLFFTMLAWAPLNYWANRPQRNFLLRALAFFLLASVVAFLPVSAWIIGKGGIVSWKVGWLVGASQTEFTPRLKEAFLMWSKNSIQVLILILPALVFGKFLKETLICCLLFIVFNFWQIAAWDWDQLKIFVTLYVIMLMLWSLSNEKAIWRMHLMLVVILIPGIVESVVLFRAGPNFAVYTEQKIKEAEVIRKNTPKNSILAAAPEHNSTVTLTGRFLFSGYEGTVWSHGLNSTERSPILKSPIKIKNCNNIASKQLKPYCPNFVLWSNHEKNYWEEQDFRQGNFIEVYDPYLFRVN